MKQSLKIKLCIAGVGLTILFVILNILFTCLWMSPFSMRLTANKMEELADSMKAQVNLPEEEFETYIEQIEDDYSVSVTVFDEEKEIIMTTSSFRLRKKKLGPTTDGAFEENRELLDKGKAVRIFKDRGKETESNTENSAENTGKTGFTLNKNNEEVKVIVIKKIGDDRYVTLGRTVRSFHNATVSSIWFELLAGLIISLIGFLMVRKISDYVVKPLIDITEVAERIANLEFDAKVPVNGTDELGQLGTSINRMSEHLERNLVQLQEDIDNRKKLVRNLSHEIKSPVAVIMGYADRMKAVISKNPEKVIKYCEIISNESSRIDVLVKEMLDFSNMEQRTEEIRPEKVQMKSLLEKVEQRIKEENMERAVKVSLQCEEQEILLDSGLIERAVYNLVNNAVNHAVPEGLVITMTGKCEKQGYSICVHNTGSHIPEDELSYIWDVFYKVDKARARNKNGCGVGLSIVREIVEAHHGSYEAGNDEAGVYFTIWIPEC